MIGVPKTGMAGIVLLAVLSIACTESVTTGGGRSAYGQDNVVIELNTVIVGNTENSFLGQSLSLNADLNGDGKNDLVVAANGGGAHSEGIVYIFYNRSFDKLTDPAGADVMITGDEPGDLFGWALTTEGDVNGDGEKDLIVSALKNDRRGKIYVFLGGRARQARNIRAGEADYIISSPDSVETFGFVVCADGDLNDDGISDLIVSAPSNPEAGEDAGKIYIFNGGGWGDGMTTADAACAITGESAHSSFGSAVSFGGDFSGNGIDDLAVGAFFASQDSGNAGRIYLFKGRQLWPREDRAAQADLIIQGYHKESWLGTAVEIIGDINKDGRHELLAGASGEYVNGDDAGAVYLIYGREVGGKIPAREADLNLVSTRIGNNFGTQIVRAGDIDGDGREDWIISEPGGIIAQEEARGRVYVFITSLLGKDNVSSVIEEPVAMNNFGNAVSAGDINGDGYIEIGVGANWDNSAADKCGKVAIFTIRP